MRFVWIDAEDSHVLTVSRRRAIRKSLFPPFTLSSQSINSFDCKRGYVENKQNPNRCRQFPKPHAAVCVCGVTNHRNCKNGQ